MKSLELKDRIEAQAYDSYGQSFYELHEKEQFVTVGNAVMEYLVPKWIESKKKFSQQKQAYYFSAEFLMGRALSNNLTNLEIEKNVKETLEEMGVNYNILEEAEDDAGLGNLLPASWTRGQHLIIRCRATASCISMESSSRIS